jgi:hypothetical protein
MSALEQVLGGPAIEVVAKATRWRFTVEYKRKILREAETCKTPGAIGALPVSSRHIRPLSGIGCPWLSSVLSDGVLS